MGSVWSCCCGNDESESGLIDERTRLLTNPVSNAVTIQRGQTDDFFHGSSPRSMDEQSVLNRILQDTATNVIDIAALGPSNVEQNEYLEKRTLYNSKLTPIIWPAGDQPLCCLEDVPSPESLIEQDPITPENMLLVKRTANRIKKSLKELKVYHSEDLIVPFAIP